MNHARILSIEWVALATLALMSSHGLAATTCSIAATPAISAGYAHVVALKNDGSLAVWGKNNTGQLGDGTTSQSLSPKQIGTGYKAIAAGKGPDTAYTLAVKSDGSLWAWGDNTQGQLGDGSTTAALSPKQIGTATGYLLLAAGYYHSLAIKSDGTLWAWGKNDHGQLGDGSTTPSLVPKQIGTDTSYVAIAAGESHSVTLKSDGSLWAWGQNGHGQLGNGSSGTDVPAPGNVGSGYSLIAAGKYHTAAIKTGGTLWTWGDNSFGQLGDGGQLPRSSPGQVGTDTGHTAIAAGYGHTVAVKNAGEVWAWGGNLYGSLGDGTILDSFSPKRIDTGYATVTAGNFHTAALKTDGSLWAWGDNGFGQVGDGTTTSPVTSPKTILSSGYSAPDFVAPTAPSGFTAKQAGAGANLSWTAATDNVSVKGYFLYRDTTLVASPTTASYKDSGLAPSTTYTYTLAAYDGSCNISPSIAATLTTSSDTQVPMVPADLKATQSTSSTGVALSWKASIDDIGVTSYQVYRGGTLLASEAQGNVTSYTDNDPGMIASTEYSYTIAACDAAGYCSALSAPVSVITPQKLTTTTSTIANLTALAKTISKVDLTWTASSAAASYNIYRNGALVGNSSTTSFSDTGLTASSSYAYTVAACDAAGLCSAQSAPASAITLQIGAADSSQGLSDCLFNWAELNYATYFAPRGSQSQSDGPYYWRSYSQTSAYLAVFSGKLYYLGPASSNAAVDLGAASTWYSTAGCQ
ncbi:MAG: hypothetical protein D4S02_00725 [Rhodocyclaceae bacterium]|nr:MAG: hypothetical protein D4S02_00725 [Rhodocyclaceae bacterium]